MSRRQFPRSSGLPLGSFVFSVLALVACAEQLPSASLDQSWSDVCIDGDGDGYGFQCGPGDDCDDRDPAIQTGCARCQRPDQGCACEEGSTPAACTLPHTLDTSGALICRAGTRYCRDEQWSACEGIASYTVPAVRSVGARARIDRDAGPVVCDPCNPDCYRVEDPLAPVADAAVGPGLVHAPNGGITLAYDLPDGGIDAGTVDGGLPAVPDGAVVDDLPCDTANDSDCDGLPNAYDAEPTTGSRHRTLVYGLAPGVPVTRTFQSAVSITQADVYLYLDATGSMSAVRDQLFANLTTGNHLAAGGNDVTCLDHDGDGMPDDALKQQGIGGNLSCLVRDIRFGTGFFRDIPFLGPSAVDGRKVGPTDYEMFEHLTDITTDVSRVRTALGAVTVRSNYNVPEGSMQGLWALATGSELYAGWSRPGIPARRNCPLRTWGYPCFREAALPVVVQITDAPMQNGPATVGNGSTSPVTPANCLSNAFEHAGSVSCAPLQYDAQVLGGMSSGSEGTYRPLSSAADTLATAENVGSIDQGLVTYVGDTRTMGTNLSFAQLGVTCPQGQFAWSADDETAPAAGFRFSVDGTGSYLLSSRGTRFDGAVMVVRLDAAGAPERSAVCFDDISLVAEDPLQRNDAAEVLLTGAVLPAGEYLLVLKGYDRHERGLFQMTLGRPGAASSGAFQARSWDGAGGLRTTLRDSAIRAVTVQIGNDPYAAQQGRALAQASRAIDAAGTPVSLQANGDAHIGDEIVDAVRRTLDGMDMTVSLRLVQDKFDPLPAASYRVEAVDWPNDGCGPPADLNADGLVDAHTNCRAGARPRFNVTFETTNGLPPHAGDPTGQGGYRMLAQLLGDGRFVLEEYPMYIVPGAPPPAPPLYNASGTYEELVEAKGCATGEAPTFRTQYWQSTLPAGTRVRFQMCGGDTEQDARDCVPVDVATIVPGGVCNSPADCGDTGYCSPAGVCHQVAGVDCNGDTLCGVLGVCSTLPDRRACTFSRAAADFRALPATIHGRRFANVHIELQADPTRTRAPIVHNWRLDYECAASD